jgi:hypothetical protein
MRDTIELARKAGLHIATDVNWMPVIGLEYAEKLVDVVAAHTLANIDPSKFMSYQEAFEAGRLAEREQCAKVCDSLEEQCEKLLVPDEKWPTPADCAHIIRARGNT